MTNQTSNPSVRLVALQHRDFRLMWIGQILSVIGTQMQLRAIDWHIYTLLEGSNYTIHILGRSFDLGAAALGLGTLGLIRIFPVIIFALLGGIVADTRNRKTVLLWVAIISAVIASILAIITLLGFDSLIAIYTITAALSAAAAFENPARQSLIPNLVPEEHLNNAVSLNTLSFQFGLILGPSIAGVMIGSFNIGYVYLVNAVSYLAVVVALLLMRHKGQAAAASTGPGWSSMVEGMRFVHKSRIIWSSMLLDFFATFFSSARTMLPIVAGDILGVGPVGFGILSTAQAVGSLLAGTIAALRKEVYHQGVVLLVSVILYGLATALFGVSTLFAVSYVLLVITGAADTISTVIRGTIRQIMTPDSLRGRMTSVNMLFFMGGPQLGEVEAGLVAAAFGVPFAIVTGGIATVLLTLWVAWKYPRLRRYTSDQMREMREASQL
jgi:MFS family permease